MYFLTSMTFLHLLRQFTIVLGIFQYCPLNEKSNPTLWEYGRCDDNISPLEGDSVDTFLLLAINILFRVQPVLNLEQQR